LAVLELGALSGVPMVPRQIQEILEVMNRIRIQHVIRDENDEGKDRSGEQR
jgi:hypothetical protein